MVAPCSKGKIVGLDKYSPGVEQGTMQPHWTTHVFLLSRRSTCICAEHAIRYEVSSCNVTEIYNSEDVQEASDIRRPYLYVC